MDRKVARVSGVGRSPRRARPADVQFLYALLPEHVRLHDPDPEKLGIQKMRHTLGQLDRRFNKPATR
jgi:hypothetical protein